MVDYGVEMDIYEFWCWKYYPEWIVWYQSSQSPDGQLNSEPMNGGDPSAVPPSAVMEAGEQGEQKHFPLEDLALHV